MTTVSSAMIIESVNTTLKLEAERLDRMVGGDQFPPDIVVRLDEHVQRLTEMVASLAIARYGITRRNPTFNMLDVEQMVGSLTKAVTVITSDNTVALTGHGHSIKT